MALDGIAASTGLASKSGSLEPSHALKALRIDEEQQKSSLRFSMGCQTTSNDVSNALNQIEFAVQAIRSLTASLI